MCIGTSWCKLFQTYKYVSCVVCIALFCHLPPLLCPSVDVYGLWPTNLRQIKTSKCSEGNDILKLPVAKWMASFFCQVWHKEDTGNVSVQTDSLTHWSASKLSFVTETSVDSVSHTCAHRETECFLPDKPQPFSFSSKDKTKCQQCSGVFFSMARFSPTSIVQFVLWEVEEKHCKNCQHNFTPLNTSWIIQHSS